MEDELSNAVDMLKNMLSSDEGQKQIQNIVSAFGGMSENTDYKKSEDNKFDDSNRENIEMMMKIQKIMSVMKESEGSRQAELLRSLAPFLKEERREKLNAAARLLGVGKAIEALKQI